MQVKVYFFNQSNVLLSVIILFETDLTLFGPDSNTVELIYSVFYKTSIFNLLEL